VLSPSPIVATVALNSSQAAPKGPITVRPRLVRAGRSAGGGKHWLHPFGADPSKLDTTDPACPPARLD
jgi:hypothetical protein